MAKYDTYPGAIGDVLTDPSASGLVVYRIYEGMADDIDTVWQTFWADTDPAILYISPRISAPGYHTLDNTAVTCTGTAAQTLKVIRGSRHPNARLYSASGSFTYDGSTAAGGVGNVIDIDGLSVGNIDLTFRNLNFGRIVNTRMEFARFQCGPYGNSSTAQAEFNEFHLEMVNAPDDAIYFTNHTGANKGNNSMRGTRLFATLDPYTDSTKSAALNEALDASETGVDVVDGTEFAVGDVIEIDSERMLVTNIVTNTLTVSRGFAGSTAATHTISSDIKVKKVTAFRCDVGMYHSRIELHNNGFGMTGSGSPTGDPSATGENYTGQAAVFWIEETSDSTPDLIGSHIILKSESGRVNGCELFLEDSASSPYSHEDIALLEVNLSGWDCDYMAITDLANTALPPYRFTDSSTPSDYKWAADDGTWTTTHLTNQGGTALLLE